MLQARSLGPRGLLRASQHSAKCSAIRPLAQRQHARRAAAASALGSPLGPRRGQAALGRRTSIVGLATAAPEKPAAPKPVLPTLSLPLTSGPVVVLGELVGWWLVRRRGKIA